MLFIEVAYSEKRENAQFSFSFPNAARGLSWQSIRKSVRKFVKTERSVFLTDAKLPPLFSRLVEPADVFVYDAAGDARAKRARWQSS